MKAYRKKVTCAYTAAATNAPIYFAYEANNDPKVDETVALIFDRNGVYLGWTSQEVVRKYIYGQLYYRTKKAYRINSGRRRNGIKMVIEKATNCVGLYIYIRSVNAIDMIDMDQPGAKARIQLSQLNGDFISGYTLSQGLRDPYGYFESINDEMRNEYKALCEKYQERVIETLQAAIEAENAIFEVAEMVANRDV